MNDAPFDEKYRWPDKYGGGVHTSKGKPGHHFFNMKYTLLINQRAAVEAGFDLDLVDLAIFDYFKDFCNSPEIIKVQCSDGVHFWISHAKLREDMPLLGIKTNAGIVARVEKLVAAGILVKSNDCIRFGKTLYRWGENYDKLIATPSKEFEGTPQKDLRVPPKNSLGDNIIIDNLIKDNSYKGTSENLCLFSNSKFADFETFRSHFLGPEFDGIDIAFYQGEIMDWSSSNGKKKRDWIATARNWIRSDIKTGKVRKTGGTMALDYLNDVKRWNNN